MVIVWGKDPASWSGVSEIVVFYGGGGTAPTPPTPPAVTARGNIDYDQVQVAVRLGTGAKFAMATGAFTSGHGVVVDAATGSLADAGGAPAVGTVTSVALTAPAIFSVGGSPVTTAGTLALTLANENANLGFFGPTSGGAAAPTFRSIVAADLGTTLNVQFATVQTTGNVGIAIAPGSIVSSNSNPGTLLGIDSSGNLNTIAVLSTGATSASSRGVILEARSNLSPTGDARLGQLHFLRGADVTGGKISSTCNIYVNNDGTLVAGINIGSKGYVGIGGGSAASFGIVNNTFTGFIDTYAKVQVLLYDAGTASSSYTIGISGSALMVFNSGGGFRWDNGGATTLSTLDSSGNLNVLGIYKVNGTSGFTGAVAGRNAVGGLVV